MPDSKRPLVFPDSLDTIEAIDRALDVIGRETTGRIDENEGRACAVRDASLALGYARGELVAGLALAMIDVYRGRIDAVEATLGRLQPMVDAHGRTRDRLFFVTLAAAVLLRRGDPTAALARLDAAADLAAECPPSPAKLAYFNRRGQCADALGDLDTALRSMFDALTIAEELDSPALVVNMLSNIGSEQHDAGNIDDAIDVLEEARTLVDTHALESLRTAVACNLAMCRLASGEFDAAWELLTELVEKPIIGQDPEDYAFIRLLGGEALILRGEISLAERFVAQGLRVAREIGSAAEIVHGEWLTGQLRLERGKALAALSHLATAQTMQQSGVPMLYQAKLQAQLARTHAALEDWAPAYAALARHEELQSRMRAAARRMRIKYRAIAEDAKRLRTERDEALLREERALDTTRELDRLNRELGTRLAEVESLRAQLAEQSIKDHLTGIYNRRHFENRIDELLDKRSGARFSVVLVDLDHFKRINDNHGHGAGDAVLVAFARLLSDHVRGGDFVARWGGEEFCVLMHRASAEQAADRMQAIATAFALLVVTHAGQSLPQMSFSAGIAEFPRHAETLEAMMAKADAALYEVKHSTRNAIRIAA